MRKRVLVLLAFGLLLPVFSVSTHPSGEPAWGFFGHRRINRLAVFTLPAEMSGFYKKHIEYITEHAVDPDKRRYATKHEAVRHYIDIDHWGSYPFPEVPRDWTDALAKYSTLKVLTEGGDTSVLFGPGLENALAYEDYRAFFQQTIQPQYYEDAWTCSCAELDTLLGETLPACIGGMVVVGVSEYGILPYHLLTMQRRLTRAFEEGDPGKIIHISAEMGHYIADAHVPLHTTENYNGQMTGQDGIHAFWESRLPELYADAQYDFFVGPAQYIDQPADYFWDIVLSSHLLLDEVLAGERDLSRSFPSDRQFCYEERLGQTIRTQCEAYAKAYHDQQAGQVEARMRASVLAVGSSWYTAWADAGSPDLNKLGKEAIAANPEEEALLEKAKKEAQAQGRPHE